MSSSMGTATSVSPTVATKDPRRSGHGRARDDYEDEDGGGGGGGGGDEDEEQPQYGSERSGDPRQVPGAAARQQQQQHRHALASSASTAAAPAMSTTSQGGGGGGDIRRQHQHAHSQSQAQLAQPQQGGGGGGGDRERDREGGHRHAQHDVGSPQAQPHRQVPDSQHGGRGEPPAQAHGGRADRQAHASAAAAPPSQQQARPQAAAQAAAAASDGGSGGAATGEAPVRGLFGAPLDVVVSREKGTGGVPAVVRAITAFLMSEDSEPGWSLAAAMRDPAKTQELAKHMDMCWKKGKAIDSSVLLNYGSTVVYSVLKVYLHRIPSCVYCTPETHNQLLKCSCVESDDECRELALQSFSQLPYDNIALIHHLVSFLRSLVTQKKENATLKLASEIMTLLLCTTKEDAIPLTKIFRAVIKRGMPPPQQPANKIRPTHDNTAMSAETSPDQPQEASSADELQKLRSAYALLEQKYLNQQKTLQIVSDVDDPALEFADDQSLYCARKKFSFDRVFSGNTSQETLFQHTTNHLEAAVDGYNTFILAYGPSGSGKTQTLMGDHGNPGVLTRAAKHLFEVLAKVSDSDCIVTVCMLELYREVFVDLLSNGQSRQPTIKRTPIGVDILNTNQVQVSSSRELLSIIDKGTQSRNSLVSTSKDRSLNSHSIVTVKVEVTQRETKRVTAGKLNFIAFANAESSLNQETDTTGLVTLNDAIVAVGRYPHAPYKMSQITEFLSDILGGNSKALLITFLSSNTTHNQASLKFSTNFRNLTSKPTPNVFIYVSDDNALLQQKLAKLQKENSELKAQVTQLTAPRKVTEPNGGKAPSVEPITSHNDQNSTVIPNIDNKTHLLHNVKRAKPANRHLPTKNSREIMQSLVQKAVLENEKPENKAKASGTPKDMLASIAKAASETHLRKRSLTGPVLPHLPSPDAVPTPKPSSDKNTSSNSTPNDPNVGKSKGLTRSAAMSSSGGTSSAPSSGNGDLRQHFTRSLSSGSLTNPLIEPDPSPTKLIEVKGRLHCKARQVLMSYRSLNQNSCFVLDCISRIFVWKGSKANRMEISWAIGLANRIKDKDRISRSKVDELEENTFEREFWNPLGGKHPIDESEPTGQEEDTGVDILYRVQERDTGEYCALEIARNNLHFSALESQGCFIVDGITELYLWIGKQSPIPIRRGATGVALQLLAKPNHPGWLKLIKISDGSEVVMFRERFVDTAGQLPIKATEVQSACTPVDMTTFDVSLMWEPGKPPVEQQPDDGTGQCDIWKVVKSEKEPLDVSTYGHFYSSESYLLLYKYKIRYRDCFLMFFWQGRNSTTLDKGTSAALTKDLVEKYQIDAKHIRIVQNQETQHFLKIFQNKYIVHRGSSSGHVHLYHVSGFCSYGIPYAIEIEVAASALSTNDCFLLVTPRTVFIWIGNNSDETCRDSCVKLCALITESRKTFTVQEKSEPKEFWSAIGETAPYDICRRASVRLFQCGKASGKYLAKELFNWCQDTLLESHLVIVDGYYVIYVWIGKDSSEDEKKRTFEIAMEYSAEMVTRREDLKGHLDALVVTNLLEPPAFRYFFHGWDPAASKWEPTFTPMSVDEVLKSYMRTYSLEELQEHPPHLDQSCLENYLSDEDFQLHFGKTKAEFAASTKWQQEQKKRDLQLF
ncbi:gelsolin with villin headpeace [Pelomyxa schiedti]|nr:gelsolin with villin headpeace [Pelomyxa schiedti]